MIASSTSGAKPLFGDDPIHAQTLRDISRGTGRRDDADDVLRLVTLFSESWAEAALERGRPHFETTIR